MGPSEEMLCAAEAALQTEVDAIAGKYDLPAPTVRYERPSSATFVQLERGNDWGYTYIAVKARDSSGRADSQRRIRAIPGDRVDVRWPDGAMTTETIEMRDESVMVSEHGRESMVRSQIPGFVVLVHGITAWLPLDAPGLLMCVDAFDAAPRR